jgi:hypothetical protein
MPHVVLEGTIDLNDLQGRLSPVIERNESEILKTGDFYLNQTGNSALLEAIVIENGPPKNFFLHLSKKENSLTIRLFPLTDPKKTTGVKKLIGIIAKKIQELFPESAFGKTNLQDFLA